MMINILLSNIHHSTGADSISVLLTTLVLLVFLISMGFDQINLLRIRKHAERTKDLTAIMRYTLNTSQNYVIRLSIRDRKGFNMHGDFLPEQRSPQAV